MTTKQQIIQRINQNLNNSTIDQGSLKYHSRSKSEFERLEKVANKLIDIKIIHDMLAEEFTIIQIGLASINGTDDPIMKRILLYKNQMSAMIDDLDLGA